MVELASQKDIQKSSSTSNHVDAEDSIHQDQVQNGVPIFLYFQLLFFENTYIDIVLIVVGTVCAIAAGIPFPLMAILFGQLVNDLNGATCEAVAQGSAESYTSAINKKVLQLVYISIGAFFLTFVYIVSWSIVSKRITQRLRERYFESLLRQEQSFFNKRHAGDVASRLNGDIQAIQSGTCEKVGIFIASLSFFVTAYVIAFVKEARLAGMLVSLVPAFLLVAIVGGGYTQKFTARISEAIAASSSIASEALSHIAVVEAFQAGPRLEVKFADHMLDARNDGIKKGIITGIQAGSLYFIAYSANALAFWQGSRMIANLVAGRGGGSSVACIILGSAAPLLPLFGGASSAFQRLKKDMDHSSLINSTSEHGRRLPLHSPGSIEFRNVSFEYPSRPGELILRNVNLNFPAGKHTAIVGHSGSGKSTIAGLITRLHDPTDGNVLFDGYNLRELNVRSLRSFVSLVQQEPCLLDRSILENIALGLVNSSLHENLRDTLLGPELAKFASEIRDVNHDLPQNNSSIRRIFEIVARSSALADASDFINDLEHGYGTIVGTSGKLVSGGQRQRIAIARALIREPKILILDEATASLDSASEQRIQTALDRVIENRTVISISHRLSTIKNVDNIIVLKAGEIVEQGTYAELVAKNGIFANMASLQAIDSEQSETTSISNSKDHSLDITSGKIEVGCGGIEDDETIIHAEAAPERMARRTFSQDVDYDNLGLEPNQSFWSVIKQMGWIIRPTRLWLVAALFAATIVGCTYSASGLIFGHTVGALSPCNTTTDRILYLGKFFGGILFMLAVVEFFANLISWASFGIVAEKLLYTVRVLSFRSLFEQSAEWHRAGDRNPSSLLSVITKDSAALGGFSGSIMGTIFSIMVNFLVAISLSHIIAWKIAVVCLTMVPILLGSGIMQLRSLSRFEERHSKAYAKSIGITVEAINSMKTIASLSLEHEIMGTYRRVLKSSQKETVSASLQTNIWLAISNSTGFFVYAFAYWWGSHLIVKGENTQKQFFIVLVAMLVSAQLWGQMFTLAPEISRSRASASRLLSLIAAGSTKLQAPRTDSSEIYSEQNEKDIESVGEASKLSGESHRGVSIIFDGVSFAYPGHASIPVLKNISLKIKPGQFCGLVGPSGAGKSTIMGLVQGVFTPTSGFVRIGNVDAINRSFRDDISIVPQDNSLFNGTIKFNVGLGARPGHTATDSEIEEACRLANIHEIIVSLPQQYDTECGPNGSQLSGGQRQRLTIARALVRKPRLLLLDESTSALDAESETALQEGLDRAVKNSGITVIAITHRLHTVLKADVIFVIENGTLVDSGRHDELCLRSESYRNNAQQQMLQ